MTRMMSPVDSGSFSDWRVPVWMSRLFHRWWSLDVWVHQDWLQVVLFFYEVFAFLFLELPVVNSLMHGCPPVWSVHSMLFSTGPINASSLCLWSVSFHLNLLFSIIEDLFRKGTVHWSFFLRMMDFIWVFLCSSRTLFSPPSLKPSPWRHRCMCSF